MKLLIFGLLGFAILNGCADDSSTPKAQSAISAVSLPNGQTNQVSSSQPTPTPQEKTYCYQDITCHQWCDSKFTYVEDGVIDREYGATAGSGGEYRALVCNHVSAANHVACLGVELELIGDFMDHPLEAADVDLSDLNFSGLSAGSVTALKNTICF